MTFHHRDLERLDRRLLSRAVRVIPMEDVAAGDNDPAAIGMRHDVDNVILPAVQLAEWEATRGYRSTYFVLHTAPYWQEKRLLRESLERIAECGHEIGLHINGLARAVSQGGNMDDVRISIELALGELRMYGHNVHGVVAHGDPACYRDGSVYFVNDEVFTESPRPEMGDPDRTLGTVILQPFSRLDLGLDYDPNWLPRADYLSDSGGQWSQPLNGVCDRFGVGQLHVLQHPDWWGAALDAQAVAA